MDNPDSTLILLMARNFPFWTYIVKDTAWNLENLIKHHFFVFLNEICELRLSN